MHFASCLPSSAMLVPRIADLAPVEFALMASVSVPEVTVYSILCDLLPCRLSFLIRSFSPTPSGELLLCRIRSPNNYPPPHGRPRDDPIVTIPRSVSTYRRSMDLRCVGDARKDLRLRVWQSDRPQVQTPTTQPRRRCPRRVTCPRAQRWPAWFDGADSCRSQIL